MKNDKPKYFLSAFCLSYSMLIVVMAYYFHNAYQLKEKDIASIVQEKINDFEETTAFKKIELKDGNELYKSLQDLINGKQTLEEIKSNKKEFITQNNQLLTKHIDSLFAPENYEVAVRHLVKSIYLNNDKKELVLEPFSFLETNRILDKIYRINTSTWEIELSSKRTNENEIQEEYSNHYTIYKEQQIDIQNMRSIVIKSLLPLLLSSILICVFLLLLYYITFKTIKQKEEEVLNLHNMVDTISHEFRLPIATLKYGCTNLLNEYQSPTISLLQRQIERLERLQTKLHREDTSQGNTVFTKQDLEVIIEDFKSQYYNVIITIDWQISTAITLPQTAIEILFVNLIENGIKYGGTKIGCQIKNNKSNLEITITDNGIGIDSKHLQHIFKKFHRILCENIHTTQGSGLGLYHVKQIIHQYNGVIEVKSQPKNGTIFKIIFSHA